MERIYIYGTGRKALQFLPIVGLHYTVLGFIDSKPDKRGKRLFGLPIYHVSDLTSLNYDKVIVISSFSSEIKRELKLRQLESCDIDELPELIDLYREYTITEENARAQVNDKLPRTPLNNEHLHNAELLVCRKTLLERLPSDGICAELGVANGDFSNDILSTNHPQKLHLVDIWGSHRYNESLHENVRQKFETEIAKGQVEIHRKLSSEAVQDFEDNYFDWIYIDTSHFYEGTKYELELYSKKVKDGGVIAGHDYMMGNWAKQYRYGVMEAVHEFCVKAGWKIKYLTMDLSENQSFAIERIART